MDFLKISDLFTKYLLEYPEKSIVQTYNIFAMHLFQKYHVEIPNTEELLKIGLSIRSLSQKEQLKIFSCNEF